MSVDNRVNRALADPAGLRRWLDEAEIGSGALTNLQFLASGTQNILVSFFRGAERLVLRRPPEHTRVDSNRNLLREARVLGALADTQVPHPRLRGVCRDEDVLGGVVFFVMDAVEGVNPVITAPLGSEDRHFREALAANAARELGRLGEVDHVALGLSDLGKPEGFLERQTQRWRSEFEGYLQLDGYAGEPLPHLDEVTEYLTANIPQGFRPGLMHGDFHLGNLLYRDHDPRVSAILDWEMTTIGDPLLDLGRFLATWPEGEEVIEPDGGIWRSGQMQSASAIIAAYAETSTRSLDELEWYIVLGCFKLGIILEGTYARACAGKAPKAIGNLLHHAALKLLARAHRHISIGSATAIGAHSRDRQGQR